MSLSARIIVVARTNESLSVNVSAGSPGTASIEKLSETLKESESTFSAVNAVVTASLIERESESDLENAIDCASENETESVKLLIISSRGTASSDNVIESD